MRGRSAPFIVCDEVDGYNTTDEGSPVSLIWQRAATFGDERFLVEISTPTLKDASYIEQAFEAGDQRHFHVCCPDCGERQVLTWGQVMWQGRRSTELKDAEKDLHEEHQPDTAAYCCEHCGTLWNDGQRIQAIRNAEEQGAGWIAAKPFQGHASYHAWEAYSTFRRLEDIVQDYLDKLRLDDLQAFANVSLARTFELKGDGCEPETLYAKREQWPDHCPDGVLYITLGADMQMDRLEYEIVGWGMHGETWSLEYGVLWGDPLAGQVFHDLETVIRTRRFTLRDGTDLAISASCLDTGGTTGYPQAAYDWLKGKKRRCIFGIKGYSPSWGNPIVAGVQRKKSGKTRRKVDIFPVAVDEAKIVIYRRIAQTVAAETQGGPGFMHIPADRDEEWFRQLTAETLIRRKGQKVQREWVKPDKARNEALDCRVYAYAALRIMNPTLQAEDPRKAPALDEQTEETPGQTETDQTPPPEDEEAPVPRIKKRRVWKPPLNTTMRRW